VQSEPGSAQRQFMEEVGLGFIWIEDLDRLQGYEDERTRFVRFDQFVLN
jgi:hypothetical protein